MSRHEVGAGPAVREGGCLCGRLRYRATGEPLNQRVCHCRRCQRSLGAAFNARLLFAGSAVAIDGPRRFAAVSSTLETGFCPDCGTTVVLRRHAAERVAITAGSMDDPSLFRPEMHVFTASMQPWLVVDDGLPQYPGPAPG